MRLLWIAAFLASSLICAEAAGYTCPPGKSKKVVTLKTGRAFDLETQSGDTYGKRVKCVVKFKRAKRNKCNLNFSCSSFALTAAKPTCKGRSDFFVINRKRYCKNTGPEVSTTKSVLNVVFKSHKKSNGGAGASCTATCVPRGAPPGDGCKCGLAKRTTRIVGGKETEVNEYPWQIAMVQKGGSSAFCGGSVISDRWILTASHCVDGTNPGDIQVLLGEHDYYDDTETESVRMGISQIIMHNQYNSQTTDYDYALLKMKTKVDFAGNPNIRPACLPTAGEDYVNWLAVVTGWGTLSSGGQTSQTLREVTVKVISNSACNSDYGGAITGRMLCAAEKNGNGGKDACQGDSGGPLVSTAAGNDGVTPGQNYELVGVVSWGYGCAMAEYAGVYSRVTDQLDWIATKTASAWNTCPKV